MSTATRRADTINAAANLLAYEVGIKLRATFEGGGAPVRRLCCYGCKVAYVLSHPERARSIMDGLGLLSWWSSSVYPDSLEVEPVTLSGLVFAADALGVPVPVSLRCFRAGVPLSA